MKKAIIVIYCLLGLISVCQAQDHLRIHYKNGTQADVPLAALQNLSGLRPNIIYESRIEGNPFIPVNEDLSIVGSEYWKNGKRF